MASNLDGQLGESEEKETDLVLPFANNPADYFHPEKKGKLELAARHAFLDIQEEMDKIPKFRRRDCSSFSLYYRERREDKLLSIQVRNSLGILYSGPYMRLFEAVAMAQLLGGLISRERPYNCTITQEIVRD